MFFIRVEVINPVTGRTKSRNVQSERLDFAEEGAKYYVRKLGGNLKDVVKEVVATGYRWTWTCFEKGGKS